MCRKKKKHANGFDEEALPTPSVNCNTDDVTDPFELLDICVAALHDKSASPTTLEAAMASLVGALEGVLLLDEADDGRCLDIFALCGVSIKKAGSSSAPTASREACLAYHAVGLLALTLRKGGATEILDQSFLMLSRTLRLAASTDALVVVAALDCIAVVTFAGALVTEQAEPERLLKAIWDVIFPSRSSGSPKTKSTQLVAAAVSAWTFLTTTVTVTDAQRNADRAAWNATIASLAGLLEANDRTIRMAAGEALAVCVELNLTQRTSRKDMEALRQSRQINNKRRDIEMTRRG